MSSYYLAFYDKTTGDFYGSANLGNISMSANNNILSFSGKKIDPSELSRINKKYKNTMCQNLLNCIQNNLSIDIDCLNLLMYTSFSGIVSTNPSDNDKFLDILFNPNIVGICSFKEYSASYQDLGEIKLFLDSDEEKCKFYVMTLLSGSADNYNCSLTVKNHDIFSDRYSNKFYLFIKDYLDNSKNMFDVMKNLSNSNYKIFKSEIKWSNNSLARYAMSVFLFFSQTNNITYYNKFLKGYLWIPLDKFRIRLLMKNPTFKNFIMDRIKTFSDEIGYNGKNYYFIDYDYDYKMHTANNRVSYTDYNAPHTDEEVKSIRTNPRYIYYFEKGDVKKFLTELLSMVALTPFVSFESYSFNTMFGQLYDIWHFTSNVPKDYKPYSEFFDMYTINFTDNDKELFNTIIDRFKLNNNMIKIIKSLYNNEFNEKILNTASTTKTIYIGECIIQNKFEDKIENYCQNNREIIENLFKSGCIYDRLINAYLSKFNINNTTKSDDILQLEYILFKSSDLAKRYQAPKAFSLLFPLLQLMSDDLYERFIDQLYIKFITVYFNKAIESYTLGFQHETYTMSNNNEKNIRFVKQLCETTNDPESSIVLIKTRLENLRRLSKHYFDYSIVEEYNWSPKVKKVIFNSALK
jgi:hypothetical protein